MIFNVSIEKGIAKFIPSEPNQKYVCSNSENKVKFTFDEDWAGHNKKFARFIWNGEAHDVEFSGNECNIPEINKTSSFEVGVYVGESAKGEPTLSSTGATIPALLSIRCKSAKAAAGSGKNYTNEARGYAEAAAQSAQSAKASEEAIEDIIEEAIEEAIEEKSVEVQAHQAYYDSIVAMVEAYGNDNVYIVEEGRDIAEYGQIQDARSAKVIALPNGLTCVGNSNFAEGAVAQIKIPPSVVSIEDGAFGDCYCLKKVDFPSKLQRINANAFGGTIVDKFKIPKSVTWIGNLALASNVDMIIDLTEFGYDTPFPATGGVVWGNISEATIRIPKGRKSELLAMTNWASGDYTIEEVEV